MSTARERLAKAMAKVRAKAERRRERQAQAAAKAAEARAQRRRTRQHARRRRRARHKARVAALRDRYITKRQGLATIATALGVHLTTVWKRLCAAGIARRPRGAPKGSRGPFAAKRAEAIERARAGERLGWIEEDLGLGSGVVSRWCRKEGVTPKRGRPREPSAVAFVDSALAAVNAHGAATTPRDLVLDLHRQGIAAKTIAADLDLAVWAPQLARVVTFVRLRGECGTGAVVKHLETSGPNGVQLLRDAERLGFLVCTGRVRRELQWKPAPTKEER